MKFSALLVSAHYLFIGLYVTLWPALVFGLLVHFIKPEWEFIAFVIAYSRLLTEFIFNRKGNWLS